MVMPSANMISKREISRRLVRFKRAAKAIFRYRSCEVMTVSALHYEAEFMRSFSCALVRRLSDCCRRILG